MKLYIRGLKLKSKIGLLTGVPLLGLLIFSSMTISENYKLYNNSSKFSNLVELVLLGSEVIHELQEERDTSIAFLASKGQKYSQQLTTVQKLTDEKFRKFQVYLEEVGRNNYSVKLREEIDESLAHMRDVSSKRSQVLALNSGIDDVIPFYREVIESFMGLDNEFVLHSPNGEVSQVASAFSIFMQIKEISSLERAELTWAFTNDGFRSGMHTKLLNLINEEENYAEEFEHVASTEQLDAYHAKMQHPVIHELNGLREIAKEKATTGKFGVDPAQWFKLATEKQSVLNAVEEDLAGDIHEIIEKLAHGARNALTVSIVAILVMLLVTVSLGILISSTIIVPVKKAVEVAEQIASGDLRAMDVSNTAHSDEIGLLLQSLRSMQAKLTNVIRASKEAAAIVKKGAEEIWVSNSNLNERTDQQAANLQETTSSMEEMAGTVRQNADNAKQASQLAKAARDLAEKGGEVVGRAVYAMNKINDSSKKIADIISVIDEIAFQTNLLALNAAVEAARAGEQGRGFAVVASEVRNLAGRSATAAKEIKGLIADSVDKVEEGSKLVNSSGSMLNDIVSSVKKVSDIIAEIASAGQEQSTGIDQVSLAVSQMDELTQQNSTMVQESAAASETMGSQANTLRDILQFFKIDNDVDMNSSSSTAVRPASVPVPIVGKLKRPANAKSAFKNTAKPSSKVPIQQPIPKAASGGAAASDEWESF